MTGLNILNEFTYSTIGIPTWLTIILFIVSLIILIGFFLLFDYAGDNTMFESIIAITGIVVGWIASFITIALFFMSFDNTPYYEVTFTEEIDYAEFNAKYEVINHKGEIYTIKEK